MTAFNLLGGLNNGGMQNIHNRLERCKKILETALKDHYAAIVRCNNCNFVLEIQVSNYKPVLNHISNKPCPNCKAISTLTNAL